MTNAKSTKRALISSVIALLVCFTMLLGTTFAWFTDSVTSAGNIIQSGNLDVAMYWAEGQKDPTAADTVWTDASTGAIFDYDKWEPGYAVARHIKIANEGTLALKYIVRIVANGTVSEKIANVNGMYSDGEFVIPTDAVAVTVRCAMAGDANLNGKINAKDVGLARQYVAKIVTLDELEFIATDVNQNGKINAKDVGLLRQYVAKVITKF